MNFQGKLVKIGDITKVESGIEWVKQRLPDGNEIQGATENPVGGCLHECKWRMADGSIAECYAKGVAEGPARNHYPLGFEHHYWKPEALRRVIDYKKPIRIFIDSMSDLMGRWVPDDQINQCVQAFKAAYWHTFILLTKNAPRLSKFDWPKNVWPGVSSAPDHMLGHWLTDQQKERYMHKALSTLGSLPADLVTFISFEPLSWDVSKIVAEYPGALRWAIIGAASNGNKYYQPDPRHVQALLEVLDAQGVPVFFKGNLSWPVWREDFPGDQREYKPAKVLVQGSLFEVSA